MMAPKGAGGACQSSGAHGDLWSCFRKERRGRPSVSRGRGPNCGHSARQVCRKLEYRSRSRTLFITYPGADLSPDSMLVTTRLKADMHLLHLSAQRHGIWLAALLLLPAQQALSLSDQMPKDVDYTVLPLLGPLLTVRIVELALSMQHPKMMEISDREDSVPPALTIRQYHMSNMAMARCGK